MRMELGEWPVAGNEVDASGVELAIEARGLVKRFDGFTAVDGVDISVPKGAIYGILGPNGAGKTTTLRMLLGIIDPDAGYRRVLGCDHPTDAARRIGYLPEERGLYPAMKATEAIAFLASLRGVPLKEGAGAGANCWKRTGWAMPPIARSASCRRAWRSRCNCWARWSTIPIWWCSTSRSPASTRSTRASSNA
jgi:ABC-2 type transport system ATP-binding protein